MGSTQSHTPAPAVKARHLKSVLDHVRALPREERDRVLASLRPGIVPAIDDCVGVEWLPISLDLAITRAIVAALGPRGAESFWRRVQTAALDSPLMKTLVEGARSLFGASPQAWARWIPAGWDLLFRECGQWHVVPEGEGGVVLRGSGVPVECASDSTWLGAVASCFAACVGNVEIVTAEPREHAIEIRLAPVP